MLESKKTTHTGLTVDVVKVLPITGLSEAAERNYRNDQGELSEQEMTEKYGAGIYNFVVNLDGVPVVIASAKAGTIDQDRAALAKKKAAEQPPPAPPAPAEA